MKIFNLKDVQTVILNYIIKLRYMSVLSLKEVFGIYIGCEAVLSTIHPIIKMACAI